ncbi:uncharacterized protein LOC108481413 [Gossypium arboreum]|uniref:Reverse transcriptase n=1 Tax=Gossypium arboreum TaxID=29729 RepID=A0ABR0MUI3_GOSAR|nr:uncharacterized protein LOC108481413 [Gossypium arboreum]KAK5777636.1 hypothetical protein PVK06_045603 [Gossypium arboreum]
MNAFREALEDCELNDFGFVGQWYTWERGRLAGNNIQERLDRGVANQEWWKLFNNYSVQYLQHGLSDYCPVIVDTRGDENTRTLDSHKKFRFNVDWLLSEELEEQVKQGWLSNEEETMTKLTELGTRLSKWAKKEKGAREYRSNVLNSRMISLSSKEISDEVLAEMTEIRLKMYLKTDREELF